MSQSFWSIVVAAGGGSRLGGTPKQYRLLAGRPLLVWSLATFAAHADRERLVLVVPPGDEERAAALVSGYTGLTPRVVAGGATRQVSVAAGLSAIDEQDGYVAVHDAARPLFDGRILADWRAKLADLGDSAALVPVLPAADTMLETDGDAVRATAPRERLAAAQTPQLFSLALLRRAHAAAAERGETDATDDASLVLAAGGQVRTVAGFSLNFKITTRADLARAEALLGGAPAPAAPPPAAAARTGIGYDVHRFDAARPLVLGGVVIPDADGLAGHSDADALAHAVMDALLGAAGLGDIGTHFPDTDPAYAGADSMDLLAEVLAKLRGAGLAPAHVDATIIAERPRLAPHVEAIRERLAAALGLPAGSVNVKATTHEGLGALGRGEGLAALAVATLAPAERPQAKREIAESDAEPPS
ncbi:MAG: 2-C-methyl-D-erythritol 2,4-cyclodiphosphate synthase [Candidatus Krumholzibacteriota bacterium]|nr:2-C-methyl-D-erythritol 2,4-cyclodiphosphate synthase [Candidatus Krumholzibacteriota bacterium]